MKTDQENVEANDRLSALLNEACQIIVDHPDLNIGRIGINEHGVHTFHKIPCDEADQLSACINAHRAALKAFADVTETEGESYAAADEAESQAFANVLAFRCRWTESKEMKVRYLLGLLRQPCAPQLDADQLESLLTSVIG